MTTPKTDLRSIMMQPWLGNIWPTVIRVTLGVLLMAFHGAPKILGGKVGFMADDLAAQGWPVPTLLAFMVAFIEFAGGILLIIGLLTRPVAAAIAVLFVMITFVYLAPEPFVAAEKAFVFLVMAIYVFFVGPGPFSIDHFLFRKTAAPEPVAPVEPPTSE